MDNTIAIVTLKWKRFFLPQIFTKIILILILNSFSFDRGVSGFVLSGTGTTGNVSSEGNPKTINCTVIIPKPALPLPPNFFYPKFLMTNKNDLLRVLKEAVDSIFKPKNPDINRSTPETIKNDGYPFETHKITTDDGYILNYYRIPHGISSNGSSTSERRPPVLLHHGLTTDSGNWVATAKNDNLAYILANAGYDVWLSNCRGTQPSQGHTNKSITKQQYWDFSFEEVGTHDLPAAFDYILGKTGFKKLYYIGHSMGTAIVFSGCSLKPELCDKIHLFIALAPSAFQYRSTSAARLLAPLELAFLQGNKSASLGAVSSGPVPNEQLLQLVQKGLLCDPKSTLICATATFLVTGYDYINTNFTVLPLFVARATSLGSYKTVRHYSQSMLWDQFSRFDYGTIENCKRYKQTIPPQYNISAIRTKTILIYGATDAFSVEEDVLELASNFNPKYVVVHKVPLPHFNHMDYMIAKNANKYIGYPVLEYMRQHPMQD